MMDLLELAVNVAWMALALGMAKLQWNRVKSDDNYDELHRPIQWIDIFLFYAWLTLAALDGWEIVDQLVSG